MEEAGLNLGNLLEDAGDLTRAREVFGEVHRRGDPRGAFMIAQEDEEHGDLDGALENFTAARMLPEARYRIARVLRRLGRETEALDQVRRSLHSSVECAVEWVDENPDDASVDERTDLLQEYLSQGDVSVLIPLANLKEEAGDYEGARDLLEASADGGEPNAFFNLGRILIEYDLDPARGELLVTSAAEGGDRMARRYRKRCARAKQEY